MPVLLGSHITTIKVMCVQGAFGKKSKNAYYGDIRIIKHNHNKTEKNVVSSQSELN